MVRHILPAVGETFDSLRDFLLAAYSYAGVWGQSEVIGDP